MRGRPCGSTRPGTYLRRQRAKRSDSPRLLPLRPGSRTLDRAERHSQSVSQPVRQAGRCATHRRHDVSPPTSATWAPGWTARSPQHLRLLWAPDARMKYERVRRGAEREALRASPACHRTPPAEIFYDGSKIVRRSRGIRQDSQDSRAKMTIHPPDTYNCDITA